MMNFFQFITDRKYSYNMVDTLETAETTRYNTHVFKVLEEKSDHMGFKVSENLSVLREIT